MNIYYLYGQETLDEVIYPMINFKSHVIARALDDQSSDFKLSKAAGRALSQSEGGSCDPNTVTTPGGAKRKAKAQAKELARSD